MLRKKSGFTLIELMVVIVIIGVLASLAIPRFTEASDKAKAADAPRVLASFESAYSAAVAEHGADAKIMSDMIIFKTPENSKWFSYYFDDGSAGNPTADPPVPAELGGDDGITMLTADANAKMGKIGKGTTIESIYCLRDDKFLRLVTPKGTGVGTYEDIQKAYYSSFLPVTRVTEADVTACDPQ